MQLTETSWSDVKWTHRSLCSPSAPSDPHLEPLRGSTCGIRGSHDSPLLHPSFQFSSGQSQWSGWRPGTGKLTLLLLCSLSSYFCGPGGSPMEQCLHSPQCGLSLLNSQPSASVFHRACHLESLCFASSQFAS